MADIRINSLPTTASASSSDDFLALDGATNGTRKLNAYSPTFGGNVVATGTLTVNSTTDSSSKDTGAIVTEGGLGVEKSATIGGSLTVTQNLSANGTGPHTFSNGRIESPHLRTTGFGLGTGVTLWRDTTPTKAGALYLSTAGEVVLAQYNGTAWSEPFFITTTGNGTLAGNLTVSGTGTSSFAGRLFGINTNSPDDFGASYSTLQINAVSTGGGAYSVFKNVADSVNFRVGADGQGVINVVSNHPLLFNTNNTERARIFASGNFGIGTGSTDGGQKLQVSGTAYISGALSLGGSGTIIGAANGYAWWKDSTPTKAWGMGSNGFAGMSGGDGSFILGTYNGSWTKALEIDSSQNATFAGKIISGGAGSTYQLNVRGIGYFDSASGSVVYVDPGASSGGVGTANNYPLIITSNSTSAITISTAQALRFHAYGAGTLTTDASGNVTASSDARLKTNLRTFARGLADVLKLSPKTYNWNETSGLETEHDYVGFVAQDVANAIPEAVYEGKDANKTLTLNDRAILAALVNAVKELNAKLA